LSHDLAINNNPAVIITFGGGITSQDITHLGCFDIPLISNIPNIVYLAPTSKEEYLSMLDWGIKQTEHPVVIRAPLEVVSNNCKITDNYDKLNVYSVENSGDNIAILALGGFFSLGQKIVDKLGKIGINSTLINPRFITGLDEELLEKLKTNHKLVVTLEDGVLDGGFGEKIARYYGNSAIKVLNYGAKKEFTNGNSLEELYKRYRLVDDLIIEDIRGLLPELF
jgi:1-deoxy-D-xylulose-5-phosphate synthase